MEPTVTDMVVDTMEDMLGIQVSLVQVSLTLVSLTQVSLAQVSTDLMHTLVFMDLFMEDMD